MHWRLKAIFHNISLLLLASSLFTTACNKLKVSTADYTTIDTLIIDTSLLRGNFEMPIDGNSLKYVRLETNQQSHIYRVDQINVYQDRVYILDKNGKQFLVFNISGSYLNKINIKSNEIRNFDIWNDTIYILETEKGKIIKLDLNGKLINELTVGFRGIQLAVLPGETFAFNTAGFSTVDRRSEHYQLALKSNAKVDLQLPFRDDYDGLKYYFDNQLTKADKGLNFISAFENILYQVDTGNVKAVTKFDFGEYNMPDSIFLKGKEFDNFNAFPFVSELTNPVNTTSYSFFKFAFDGKEGYILTNAKRRKVIAAGVGLVSGSSADYNGVIPACSYNNQLVAIIEPKAALALSKSIDKSKLQINKQMGLDNLNASDNPILLFYKLL